MIVLIREISGQTYYIIDYRLLTSLFYCDFQKNKKMRFEIEIFEIKIRKFEENKS